MLYKDFLFIYDLDINTKTYKIIIENKKKKYIIKKDDDFYMFSDEGITKYDYVEPKKIVKKLKKTAKKITKKKSTTKKK